MPILPEVAAREARPRAERARLAARATVTQLLARAEAVGRGTLPHRPEQAGTAARRAAAGAGEQVETCQAARAATAHAAKFEYGYGSRRLTWLSQ